MKTIIHIGQHKTATTSIQNWLAESRDKLKKNGYWFPNNYQDDKLHSHYMLNVLCLDKNRLSHRKSKLLNQMDSVSYEKYLSGAINWIEKEYSNAFISGCHTVVWSNEGLYLLNSIREYCQLLKLFDPYTKECKVVCCFRDKVSFLKSYSNQLKKSGFLPSDNKASFRYVKSDSWLIDYERKMLLIDEVFGSENVYFEYKKEGMISEFLKKVGIDSSCDTELRFNQS